MCTLEVTWYLLLYRYPLMTKRKFCMTCKSHSNHTQDYKRVSLTLHVGMHVRKYSYKFLNIFTSLYKHQFKIYWVVCNDEYTSVTTNYLALYKVIDCAHILLTRCKKCLVNRIECMALKICTLREVHMYYSLLVKVTHHSNTGV